MMQVDGRWLARRPVFSVAASYFKNVNLVANVGDDFRDKDAANFFGTDISLGIGRAVHEEDLYCLGGKIFGATLNERRPPLSLPSLKF